LFSQPLFCFALQLLHGINPKAMLAEPPVTTRLTQLVIDLSQLRNKGLNLLLSRRKQKKNKLAPKREIPVARNRFVAGNQRLFFLTIISRLRKDRH